MSYATCRHIRETGYLCQSPALRDRDYCFYHVNHRARRMRMAQARARNEQYWLELPPLEDMRAVQSAIERVIEALAAGLIEHKRAQLILAALRIASMNFRAVNAWGPVSRYENTGYFESVAGCPVEQLHDLDPGVDLNADHETEFTPAEQQPGRGKRPSQPARRSAPLTVQTERGLIDIFRAEEDPLEAMRDFVRTLRGKPTKTALFDEALHAGKKPPGSVPETDENKEQTSAAGA